MEYKVGQVIVFTKDLNDAYFKANGDWDVMRNKFIVKGLSAIVTQTEHNWVRLEFSKEVSTPIYDETFPKGKHQHLWWIKEYVLNQITEPKKKKNNYY